MGLKNLEPKPRLIFQGRDLKNFIIVNDVMFLYVGGSYIPIREIAYALRLKVEWSDLGKVAYVD